MKKLLGLICAFALFAATLCLSACSGEAVVNYKLSEDGTHYIVSGVSGNVRSLRDYEIPEKYAAEEGGELLPVTEIGDEAFMGCSSLYTITLPGTIEKIAARAFMNCSFTSFTIPESVTEIGYGAFGMCSALKKIVIPEAVTKIDALAFAYCRNLETVVIKGEITELLPKTFANSYAVAAGNLYTDTSLKAVYLPASLKKIYFNAFDGNMIEDIYFAGSGEQWDGLYFYEYEKEEDSGENKERKLQKDEIIGSNIKLHLNAEYPQ